MLDLWQTMPEFPSLEGWSLKILTPRTGDLVGQIIITESTSASPEMLGGRDFVDPAEGLAFAKKVHALETRECTAELLREVD